MQTRWCVFWMKRLRSAEKQALRSSLLQLSLRRKGTVADKLPGQLTDAQKTERSGQLLALEKEQSREFRAHYLGQEVEVLIEEQKEIGGKVYWLGHTDTYVKAAFAADSAECMDYSNRLVHGRAVSFLSDEVLEIALNF